MRHVIVGSLVAVVLGCGAGEPVSPKNSGEPGQGVTVPKPHVRNINFCMKPGDNVLHMAGCSDVPDGCEEISFDEAMERGAVFCDACEPQRKYLARAFGPYPQKPERVDDQHTACEADADCALAPEAPCGCEPCGLKWRRAANVERVKWLEARYAEESCNPAASEGCETCKVKHMQALPYLLGNVARCVHGHCEAFEK